LKIPKRQSPSSKETSISKTQASSGPSPPLSKSSSGVGVWVLVLGVWDLGIKGSEFSRAIARRDFYTFPA
jgi:hypothetical protein